MTDLFQEIQKEIEQERLILFFKKYMWYIFALLILLAFGSSGILYYQDYKIKEKQKFTENFLNNPESNTENNFLLSMHQVNKLLQENKTTEANDILYNFSISTSVDGMYRDYAKMLLLAYDNEQDPAEFDAARNSFILNSSILKTYLLISSNVEEARKTLQAATESPNISERVRNSAKTVFDLF